MRKRIKKHIENKDFVKVYIIDTDGDLITYFQGIIFEQSKEFILMNDTTDFNFDGFIVLRKSDVSEIKHTENETFFNLILDNEQITTFILNKRKELDFSLDSLEEMSNKLKVLGLPVIIECKYRKDERFIIGPIDAVSSKKVKIKYFNAKGEYELKPIPVKLSEITYLRIESPYANLYYKYAKEVG